ncbi:MAG: hypothetical protein ACLR8P_13060 [Clostridium fessum]
MEMRFSICAGLEQVIDYVKNLHFDDADIEYLRGLGIFDEDFLELSSQFQIFRRHLRNPGRHRCLSA